MKRFLFAALIALLPVHAQAVEPDEKLVDPALEARAREISKELRCVVCQNQDIDSSNAGVARDLRLLVRERLTAGDSDNAVIDFIRARYGDYVLLKPPLNQKTVVLWLTPIFLVAAAVIFGGFSLVRARRSVEPGGIDEQDEARIQEALAAYGKRGSE